MKMKGMINEETDFGQIDPVAEPSGVQRDQPNLPQSEEQFVTSWQDKIKAAKKYFDEDFKRMRDDMTLARQGASKEWVDDGNYVVPIINRYMNQVVASLYAKNPTAYAERRKTLDFVVWDGKMETAQAAIQQVQEINQMLPTLMAATATGDPMAMASLQSAEQTLNGAMSILQDIENVRQKRQMIEKIGKTLEILFDYYANEQKPKLKPSMKAMVRRAKTCGVAYLKLGFQRLYAELSPDETAELSDARNKLGEFQRRMQDLVDDQLEPEKEKYELEKLIEELENKENLILREGPLFMFPRATEIIIDPRCRQLVGFIGAGWIAREFHKSPDEVQKIYQVDLKKGGFTPFKENGAGRLAEYHRASDSDDTTRGVDNKDGAGLVCVWEVENKDLGQVFTIADGYKGFLKPCSEPDYWMEGFWSVFAITFNASEDEDHLYPLSDVHQLRHVQSEYNRSREYRRLHREANKPKYMVLKGRLSNEDLEKLANHTTNAVLELEGMVPGEKIENLIQNFKPIGLDPALYETNSEMEDVLRTVGAQEANIGGASGGTATESSIAEGSRMTSLSSNVDDLDEFLQDVATATGQLMLKELSKETVLEIAGPGAVWPELNRDQIVKETLLRVKAGSSGRPNKAADLANMERGMPYILQLPGMNPTPIAKRYLDLLDIDIEDALIEGMPSITALNSMMGRSQMGAGTPNDPAQQGNQGVNNNKSTQSNEPGPQPGFTQPQI